LHAIYRTKNPIYFATGLLALLAPLLANPETVKPLVVHLQVVDAAGITTKVRMEGIDAPESSQSCKYANGSDYACGE
jgi:endonuclease YncB( thermonuclease family)